MKNLLLIAITILSLMSCDKDEPQYVFPKDYFPAYPESYWVYSNGTTIKVDPQYYKHSYYSQINTNTTTQTVFVPRIDGDYVYQYSITQNDNRVPLKKLLSETYNDRWIVGYWEGYSVYRMVVNKSAIVTLSDSLPDGRITFDSCIVVQEFLHKDTIDMPWMVRETYAPYVGLIKRELKQNGDSIVEKELVDYKIMHQFND